MARGGGAWLPETPGPPPPPAAHLASPEPGRYPAPHRLHAHPAPEGSEPQFCVPGPEREHRGRPAGGL